MELALVVPKARYCQSTVNCQGRTLRIRIGKTGIPRIVIILRGWQRR